MASAEENVRVPSYGWAARDSSGVLSPYEFTRRAADDNQITVKILFCGLCHTDVHFLKNDFGISPYPLVPGHEIVGEVTKVGSNVTKFSVGDIAGVGDKLAMCSSCPDCKSGLDNYCAGAIMTYGGRDRDGSITHGGYSDKIIVDENCAVKIPKTLPLAGAAPLLCAGGSAYGPMVGHGLCQPGQHLGVVGLGGVGHMAVKFGKAFGMKVTVISTSPGKKQEALERLGADEFLVSKDEQQMKGAMGTMDGIIDTVSVSHPLTPLLGLLKTCGKLILLGAIPTPLELSVFQLLKGGNMIAGSRTAPMKELQEMIEFAAIHNITADVEVVPMDYVNSAIDRLLKNDVKYRFVFDVANTLKSPTN